METCSIKVKKKQVLLIFTSPKNYIASFPFIYTAIHISLANLSARSPPPTNPANPTKSLVHTTEFSSVLQSTSLHHRVLDCTTKYQSVLQIASLYYRVLVCTTEYKPVPQSTTLYYKVPACTTDFQYVLHNTSLHYRVLACTTKYQSVLQSTRL